MDNNVSDMIMVKQWYGVMVQHVWFAMILEKFVVVKIVVLI